VISFGATAVTIVGASPNAFPVFPVSEFPVSNALFPSL